MNYRALYDRLISNASSQERVKSPEIYFENHHIMPRSLGGSDDSSNMVLLTAKEHYIAHHLLYAIHRESINAQKMAYAWFCMCNMNHTGKRYNASSYHKAKEAFSHYNRGSTHNTSDKSIYHFQHKSGEEFIGLRCDFIESYSMNKTMVSHLISGRATTTNNWRLYSTDNYFLWKALSFKNANNDIFVGTPPIIKDVIKLSQKVINEMIALKRRESKGWVLIAINGIEFEAKAKREYPTENNNPAFDATIYKFIHEDGMIFEGTRKDFIQKFNLVQSQVSAVLHGRCKSTNGWKLKGNI